MARLSHNDINKLVLQELRDLRESECESADQCAEELYWKVRMQDGAPHPDITKASVVLALEYLYQVGFVSKDSHARRTPKYIAVPKSITYNWEDYDG